jgi:aldehyde dehydrogenase (NAD+)
MELGGKCPAVVDIDVNMDHATDKLCFAKFSNSGQTCVAPDYLFVHESRLKEFVNMLIVKIKNQFGESEEGSADMGKVINNFHVERLTRLMKTSGGQIAHGGKIRTDIKYI